MLKYLENTSGSEVVYVLRTAALTLAGAFFVLYAHNLIVTGRAGFPADQGTGGPDFGTTPFAIFFGMVLVSPILETLVMWPILAGLKRLFTRPWLIAFASAGVWAALHSWSWLPWGIYIFWPFFLMSLVFLHWQKVSNTHAYWMTCAVHMVHNSVPASLVILDL